MTRNCRDCRHCINFGAHGLRCTWEKSFLPPSVQNARLWGKDAPETYEKWAEDCNQFAERPEPVESEDTRFAAAKDVTPAEAQP